MSPLHNSASGISVLYDTLTTTINLLTLNPLPYIEVDYMNATDKKLAHRRNMLTAMDTIAHEINDETYFYERWLTNGVPDYDTIEERDEWIEQIINNEEWYMDTVQCYMLIMSELIATKDMHSLTY